MARAGVVASVAVIARRIAAAGFALAFALFALFAVPPVLADTALDQSAAGGGWVREGSFDGVSRRWLQFGFDPIRGEADRPPRAIIVLLHGNGGSAEELLGIGGVPAAPYGQWLEIGRREQLVLLAPDGAPGSNGRRGWNDCRSDAATNPATADTDFLMSLIAAQRQRYPGTRIPAFVVGTSNGGNMALRLAIERPQQLGGVAAIVAAMPAKSECPPPTRPINVLFMNGTADPVLPYQGGAVGAGPSFRGTVLSTAQSVDLWRGLNGSRDRPQHFKLPDLDRNDGSRVDRYLWSGQSRAEVILYRVNGGGHTAPSRAARIAAPALQNGDIESADVIWNHFSKWMEQNR